MKKVTNLADHKTVVPYASRLFGGYQPLSLVIALIALTLAAGAVVATVPSSADAADTVIGFDDLAAGTVVKDQYQGQGLRLSRAPSGDALEKHLVTAASPGPGNVLELDGFCGEFCMGFLLSGRLESGAQHIQATVTAGKFSGSAEGGFEGPPTLRALNSQGQEIGKTTKPFDTPLPYTLSFSSPLQTIQFFSIGGVKAIDNVTFDEPGGPQAPDFTITPQFSQGQSASSVPVTAGGSVTIPILLNRFNGSSGPIAFSAMATSGIVNDVKTDPLPGAFTGADGSVVNLKLKVDKDSLDGANTIKVTAKPGSAAAGSTTRSFTFKLVKYRDYDLSVDGIEVTQGVQSCRTNCGFPNTLPFRDPANPSASVKYAGVPLVSMKTTVVRVYANQTELFSKPVKDVGMQLEGFGAQGNPLPGSPLLPYNGNATLTSGVPYVGYDRRADPNSAFNFVLPAKWHKTGTIRLRATVLAPDELFATGPGECTTSTCKVNNVFELTGVTFTPTSYITVTPVALLNLLNPDGWPTREKPDEALSEARNVVPLRDGGLTYDHLKYQGAVYVLPPTQVPVPPDEPGKSAIEALNKSYAKANDAAMADDLDDWNDDHLRGDLLVGVFDVTGFGLSRGKLVKGDNPIAVAHRDMPFKSVAHEVFHGLGRVHASACDGGGSDGQVSESWPPDQTGELQGVGFDMGSLTPVGHASDTSVYKDFMSYCAKDSASWVSTRGWTQTFADIVLFNKFIAKRLAFQPSQAVPAGPVLRVRAFVDDAANTSVITSVTPRTSGSPAPPSSDFTLVAKGAAGEVLATSPMNVAENHVDGEPATISLKGDVPATGAVRVEIVRGGQTIAERTQSTNAPRVQMLAPRAGATVGRARTTVVRWSAADPDGDELRVKIDHSTDDGRNWRSIANGPLKNTIALPSTLFAGSRRARVRVRVNDGFRETAAVSGRFTAAGRPPSVSILNPQPGLRLFNDAPLNLSGQAFDDAFREVAPRGLTWTDGRRIVGHGRTASVTDLAPGLHTIGLTARDRAGRRATSSVRIRLLAARPRFQRLDVPQRVSISARFVSVRVSSTLPGQLRVGRLRVAVGATARAIRIPVRRGARAITLTLRLTAYGKTSTRSVRIARR